MLCVVLLVLYCCSAEGDEESSDNSDVSFGASSLIASLRNDANLDLSVDEEYEDLRAELLAYHEALTSLSRSSKRRSMLTTPCWRMGGICVRHELCPDAPFLTEVPGCKNRLNVCCMKHNQFRVRDMKHHDIDTIAFPWSIQHDFGGEGVLNKDLTEPPKKKKNKKHSNTTETRTKKLAVIVTE